MSIPEHFLTQLHELHYGTSRLEKRRILPKHLLDFICKPIVDHYRPPFREYLEKCYKAVNAFRDELPIEAWDKYPSSLLTTTKTFPLSYIGFAKLFFDKNRCPPFRLDFDEWTKPGFYESEPDDPDERRGWRDRRRYYQDDLAEWKEQKRLYERKQRELPKLTRVETELLGTPFTLPEHWEYQVPFEIPHHLRFGHQFLVGASRSGKTTFLTAQLLDDLKRVERGECSVIVMDSQNQFVPNISRLALFGKGQPLEGKLIYLEPKEYPIAANIFSGDFRASYDTAEFFLNSIFKSDVSSQQTTVLRYVLQAVAVIPNATVATLRDLMEDGGYTKYEEHFTNLDPIVRNWLKNRLNPKDKDFSVSRTAIRNRIDGFLADPFFRAMFTDPRNRLDLFEELKTPKVILVNTADLGGALEPFGRFFIAKLDEAMLKRKNTPKRLPVFCYIDEASDYIADEPLIANIIDKLGKQMLGMIISVQRKAFIVSANVLDALEHVAVQAWTIKPPTATVALVGEGPVDVTVQHIELDKQPPMSEAEYEAMRRDMRRRYGSAESPIEQPLPRAEPEIPTAKPKPIVSPNVKPEAKPW